VRSVLNVLFVSTIVCTLCGGQGVPGRLPGHVKLVQGFGFNQG
jgi:hypothetical protein